MPRMEAMVFTGDDDVDDVDDVTNGMQYLRTEASSIYSQASAISLIEERPAERQKNVVRRKRAAQSAGHPQHQEADTASTLRPSLFQPFRSCPCGTTRRTSSQASFDAAAEATSPSSVRTSRTGSTLDRGSGSIGSSPLTTAAPAFPPPEIPSQIRTRPEPQHAASPIDMAAWKVLPGPKNEKAVKDPSVYWVDVSSSSATLAAKHGNNMIKVWSVGSGEVQAAIKISCYTTAQPRSREYFVRSHAILSESSTMIAIATGFGDTVEIWDWSKKKKLQSISHADRWAAVRWNVYDAGWTPLVVYRGEEDTIDLYATSNSRKPLKKLRTIELNKAGLPVLPKYPELAFSSTGPLLVAASGPRPPRLGHPPPERETILVAWQIHNDAAEAPSVPYKVVTPWQHMELDTALPNDIATYGSVAVSIWIPASYRAIPVPAARGGQGYNLAPVPVPFRYVLIWDFSASSTRTFRIPNCISCVSPDCRYVAYCDARGTNTGARGLIVLLDAMSGKQLWCWPDPDATANDSGPQPGFEQFEHLNRVIDLSFSADSGFLFVGDSEGCIGVYEVREREGQWPGVQLHAR